MMIFGLLPQNLKTKAVAVASRLGKAEDANMNGRGPRAVGVEARSGGRRGLNLPASALTPPRAGPGHRGSWLGWTTWLTGGGPGSVLRSTASGSRCPRPAAL